MLAAQVFQVLLEQSTHLDDAVSHVLDLTEPLLVQGRVVHDGGGDAGTVDGRVGVQRTGEDLDLRVDALLLLGRLANEGESTDTLTVETLKRRQQTQKSVDMSIALTMFLAKLWQRAMLWPSLTK